MSAVRSPTSLMGIALIAIFPPSTLPDLRERLVWGGLFLHECPSMLVALDNDFSLLLVVQNDVIAGADRYATACNFRSVCRARRAALTNTEAAR